MSKRGPVVGNWYQDAAEDEIFEVIAVDEDGIAIQYLNGDISEIDPETWAQMVLLPAEPPDDLNEIEELMLGEDDEEVLREASWDDPFNDDDNYADYDEY